MDHLKRHKRKCGGGAGTENKKPVKKFHCSKCDYSTPNNKVLEHHFQAKHVTYDPEKFKCSKCRKSFTTNQLLKRHEKSCGNSEKVIVNSEVKQKSK